MKIYRIFAALMLISPIVFATEAPVIDQGSDYDRISGNSYFWSIRDNGTVEIIGQDTSSAAFFKIAVSSDGDMIVINRENSWHYLPSSDICQYTNGRIVRGIKCIPPVVQQFFSKHEFKPPHPMLARVTEL